jgi:hypothetical protein
VASTSAGKRQTFWAWNSPSKPTPRQLVHFSRFRHKTFTIHLGFQGFAAHKKIFRAKSIAYECAQKIGNFTNRAENKGKTAILKSSPQSYPQIPWTALLLPRSAVQCSPDPRIDAPR